MALFKMGTEAGRVQSVVGLRTIIPSLSLKPAETPTSAETTQKSNTLLWVAGGVLVVAFGAAYALGRPEGRR